MAAIDDSKKESEAAAQSRASGGDVMKIVVINSSPHSEAQSTSRYLAQRFVDGAKSAGHEIFIFDAAHEETHPCQGCDHCGMDGDCVFNDTIQTKLMPKMLEADLLEEAHLMKKFLIILPLIILSLKSERRYENFRR